MHEIRKDPLSGRVILFSESRAHRPTNYARPVAKTVKEQCPFCGGNEHLTPPEIYRCEEVSGEYDWKIRVIPNKFPALSPNVSAPNALSFLHQHIEGGGRHEVIVESPRHISSFSDLGEHHIEEVLNVFKQRLLTLREDNSIAYGVLFKNEGPESGATIEHIHSQLIALPFVPEYLLNELSRFKAHHDTHNECLLCAMNKIELEEGERLIDKNEDFIAYCPYASRFPYEIRIAPLVHEAIFENSANEVFANLSSIFSNIFVTLKKVLKDFSYNFFIRSSPIHSPGSTHYHWYIEIVPRLTNVGGFELGFDTYINAVFPEKAAAKYNSEK